MRHQFIAKVLARIQEGHTWPGIRRSVGQYVSQCLNCQQVRDKPGDDRFHLKNIQSGYFNELVQYECGRGLKVKQKTLVLTNI